jgi:hypothetical protein
MSEPHDLRKYELLTLFIQFLPMETHVILSNITVMYNRVNPTGRERLVGLLTDLLFRDPVNPALERDFVSFLLICAPALFAFPPRAGRQFRIAGERIIVVDEGVARSYEGVVPDGPGDPFVPRAEWEAALRNFDAQCDKLSTKGQTALSVDWELLNERLVAAIQSAEASLEDGRSIDQFEFDTLFVAN